MRVFKYHALGNSYLIVDPQHVDKHIELFDYICDNVPTPTQQLVKTLCSESYGIGSNGLLFGPLITQDSDTFQLQIINSDATMAGLSGNGIRIFAKYLIDAGYVPNLAGKTITIEVLEHAVDAAEPNYNQVSVQIIDTDGPQLEVSLNSCPKFGPEAVVANLKLIKPLESWYCVQTILNAGNLLDHTDGIWSKSDFVDIGNPHCITFVDKREYIPNVDALMNLKHELQPIAYRAQGITFKNGCNLQWAFVEDRSMIHAAIFERGEGPTLASGSSASAVAATAFKHGLVDSSVKVSMPGGLLKICLKGSPDNISGLSLIGSATRIFDGYVDPESLPRKETCHVILS